jgi:hypothetical protein
VDDQRDVPPEPGGGTGAPRMRPARPVALAAFLAMFASAGAAAAAPSPQPQPAKATSTDDDLGHRFQLNVRAEFLTGYRMLFRYDKSPPCAPWKPNVGYTDQQKFCGFNMPAHFGLAAGFAILDFFEPFAFVRFGLSNEAAHTNSNKSFAAGIGARLYTMSDSRFKIFFEPWIGLDTTSGPVDLNDPRFVQYGAQSSWYKTDTLVHLGIGPQYDIARSVGIYAYGGLTAYVLRYLGANAEVSIGVQLRAP